MLCRLEKDRCKLDVHAYTIVIEGFEISGCSLKEKVVRISAPNLSIAAVDAKPGEIWFENVPKLAEASFGIRCRIYRTMQRFASAVSCFTLQLQKLTFHVSYHKVRHHS